VLVHVIGGEGGGGWDAGTGGEEMVWIGCVNGVEQDAPVVAINLR
jgi:hypothetical protein